MNRRFGSLLVESAAAMDVLAMMTFETPDQSTPRLIPERLVLAGWTGRDPAEVERRLQDLDAIGAPRPASTPVYREAPPHLVHQGDRFGALGADTGGEAEPVLFQSDGEVWVTAGSDHTDRVLETSDVILSKLVCPKPIARAAWRLSDVAAHFDRLRISSWTSEDGALWTPYQDALLSALRPIAQIIESAPRPEEAPMRLGDGTVLFCGSIPILGPPLPTPFFRVRLEDPVRGRRIETTYGVAAIRRGS